MDDGYRFYQKVSYAAYLIRERYDVDFSSAGDGEALLSVRVNCWLDDHELEWILGKITSAGLNVEGWTIGPEGDAVEIDVHVTDGGDGGGT